MAYFTFQSIDPVTGNEIWVDSSTGETQIRPNTRTIQQTQAPPAKTLNPDQTIGGTTALVYTQDQINQSRPAGDPTTTTQVGAGSVGTTTAKANQAPGVGAASDDKGTTNTYVPSASTASTVVTPAPNALDQYASYTYSLSWYLLTPEQQAQLVETAKLNTNEWSLIMQSAGAPIKERNKYFTLDYYMDNLEIETSYLDNVIAAVTNISFTVTEPNGITLLANLNRAVRDLYKQDLNGLAARAFYVMVVRFYGWDANGNLITKTSPAAGASNTLNTTNAAVVKFYPFSIIDFKFTAASKAVEYRINGKPVSVKYGMSSALGSVPHPIELVGETVDDILNGSVVAVKAGDDSKRVTTSIPPGSTRDSLATSVFLGGAVNDTGIGYNVGATANGA